MLRIFQILDSFLASVDINVFVLQYVLSSWFYHLINCLFCWCKMLTFWEYLLLLLVFPYSLFRWFKWIFFPLSFTLCPILFSVDINMFFWWYYAFALVSLFLFPLRQVDFSSAFFESTLCPICFSVDMNMFFLVILCFCFCFLISFSVDANGWAPMGLRGESSYLLAAEDVTQYIWITYINQQYEWIKKARQTTIVVHHLTYFQFWYSSFQLI